MSELFLFDRCNLINSALVATTFKRGIKEYVNELQRKAGADDTLAEQSIFASLCSRVYFAPK